MVSIGNTPESARQNVNFMTFDEVILDKVILAVCNYIFQFTKTKFHSANEGNREKFFLQNLIGVDSRLNEVEGEIIESKKTKTKTHFQL